MSVPRLCWQKKEDMTSEWIATEGGWIGASRCACDSICDPVACSSIYLSMSESEDRWQRALVARVVVARMRMQSHPQSSSSVSPQWSLPMYPNGACRPELRPQAHDHYTRFYWLRTLPILLERTCGRPWLSSLLAGGRIRPVHALDVPHGGHLHYPWAFHHRRPWPHTYRPHIMLRRFPSGRHLSPTFLARRCGSATRHAHR